MTLRRALVTLAASLVSLFLMTINAAAQPDGTGLPPEFASSGITVADWEDIQRQVSAEARRAGVAEAALMAAAERAGVNLAASGRYKAANLRDAIINQLEIQAQSIAVLTERLTVLIRAADPEIGNLLNAARTAINEGRLEDAERSLALAEESDLAAIVVSEARAEQARTRLAEVIILQGGLEKLENPGEIAEVRAAVASYESALASLDRDLSPNDWARTQFNFGVAHALLAQTGDAGSRISAIAAFDAAGAGFEALNDSVRALRAWQLSAALRSR